MKYVKGIDIVEKINSLRELLEFKIKSNNGIITKEIIKISQDLDKLIVTYYPIKDLHNK